MGASVVAPSVLVSGASMACFMLGVMRRGVLTTGFGLRPMSASLIIAIVSLAAA